MSDLPRSALSEHRVGHCYWCGKQRRLTHVAGLMQSMSEAAFEACCTGCAESQSARSWIQHFRIATEPDFQERLRTQEEFDR